jgi:hypothetical protein
MGKETTLTEIASRIDVHLRRMEHDPAINPPNSGWLYCARAGRSGAFVAVSYKSYHRQSTLTRAEAETYLAWLDSGNSDTHYQAKMPDRKDATGKETVKIYAVCPASGVYPYEIVSGDAIVRKATVVLPDNMHRVYAYKTAIPLNAVHRTAHDAVEDAIANQARVVSNQEAELERAKKKLAVLTALRDCV